MLRKYFPISIIFMTFFQHPKYPILYLNIFPDIMIDAYLNGQAIFSGYYFFGEWNIIHDACGLCVHVSGRFQSRYM